MNLEDVKQAMKRKHKGSISSKNLLSSGSTILNLACSGRSIGSYPKGTMIHFVGDSASGKSWLCLNALAEAAINKNFRNYRFIHDNPENGVLMDIARFFGKAVQRRMEPPAGDRDEPIYSTKVEEFYDYVEDAQKDGRPFIYILDSMDALSSDEEGEQIEKERSARLSRKPSSGSYGTSRAKINSARLRRVVAGLRDSGSILIVLSQTRANIGFTAKFKPKTYAGGLALRFFAHLQIWTSIRNDITKLINGKKRQLGIISRIKIEKNRITGRERMVEVPILHSLGIDDVGSCIDFLVEESHWKIRKKLIEAPEFDFTGKRDALIKHIEFGDDEPKLRSLVADIWTQIENACVVKRKNRYE